MQFQFEPILRKSLELSINLYTSMFIPVFTTISQTFLIDRQENGLRNCEIATKQNTMPTLKIAIMQKCLRYNIK